MIGNNVFYYYIEVRDAFKRGLAYYLVFRFYYGF